METSNVVQIANAISRLNGNVSFLSVSCTGRREGIRRESDQQPNIISNISNLISYLPPLQPGEREREKSGLASKDCTNKTGLRFFANLKCDESQKATYHRETGQQCGRPRRCLQFGTRQMQPTPAKGVEIVGSLLHCADGARRIRAIWLIGGRFFSLNGGDDSSHKCCILSALA